MPASKPVLLPQWLRVFIVSTVVISSVFLGMAQLKQGDWDGSTFSADSLSAMRELNFEHEMYVEDLYAVGKESTLISQLSMANSLFTQQAPEEATQGLIASWEVEDEAGVLLLQPSEELSEEELEALARDYATAVQEFSFVEIDQTIELEGFPSFWGATQPEPVVLAEEDSVEVEPLRRVRIAVVDSGTDGSHELFSEGQVETGWSTITLGDGQDDEIGHGTHVAGIVAQNMPGASIVPVQIVNKSGGSLSNVISAFRWAIDEEVNVINASFGVFSPSHAMKHLLEEAREANIVVVAAAGNNATTQPFYPASYDDEVVAVASVDAEGQKMEKSNYGAYVDVAASGKSIWSSLPNGGYGYKSGTSQAAAFVSAAVGRIMAANGLENSLSFDMILDALEASEYSIQSGPLAGVPIVE